MFDNLSIAVHTFPRHMLTSLSVDEMLVLRYINVTYEFLHASLAVSCMSGLLIFEAFYLKGR